MSPTEYQKGKYRSLVKEIPELEKKSTGNGWKWVFVSGAFVIVVGFVIDYFTEKPSGLTTSQWLKEYHWISLFAKSIFWVLIMHFLNMYGLRSQVKSKKKELAQLQEKYPELNQQAQTSTL